VDVQRLVARTEICQSGVSVASYTVRGKPVLYCIVLYCTVLYCIVLYCIVQHETAGTVTGAMKAI